MSEEPNNKLMVRLLGPAADSAGETLQSAWEVVFGGFDFFCKKKNYLREKAFEEFKQSCEQKIIEIPAENLAEPKLSILGPTLEASKFYFEEKPLREMFASLAAASMDTRKESELHPSYPEIIKQMSPLDAENLAFFRSQRPVAEYYKAKRNGFPRNTYLTNVFLANRREPDLELQSRSLTSLARLGLIEIEYEQTILAGKFYTEFYKTDFFLSFRKSLSGTEYIPGVRYGRARATPLGKSFMAVCLGN